MSFMFMWVSRGCGCLYSMPADLLLEDLVGASNSPPRSYRSEKSAASMVKQSAPPDGSLNEYTNVQTETPISHHLPTRGGGKNNPNTGPGGKKGRACGIVWRRVGFHGSRRQSRAPHQLYV